MNSATLNVSIEVDDNGSKKIAQIGDVAKTAGKKGERSFKGMRGQVDKVKSSTDLSVDSLVKMGSIAFTGTLAGLAALSAGVVALVTSSGTQALEMENLSRLAQMNSEDFQNAAFATQKLGINAEKLADISKDVQDKLGDFVATGGGEFSDFFEKVAPKVGLTAQELQGLAGPDVLVAVKHAMDQANISAEEQVFYMEAIANDAALLTPLLQDNGKALKEQADRASELGIALSEVDSKRLLEAKKRTTELTAAMKGLKGHVSGALAPVLSRAGDLLLVAAEATTDWWNANDDLIRQGIDGFIEDTVGAAETLITKIADVSNSVTGFYGNLKTMNSGLESTYGGPSVMEWGVIGALLLKGPPGAGALGAALITINNALGTLDMNIGSLPGKWDAYTESFGRFWDGITGVRDADTSEVISLVDQYENKITGLNEKISNIRNNKGFALFRDPVEEKRAIAEYEQKIRDLSQAQLDLSSSINTGTFQDFSSVKFPDIKPLLDAQVDASNEAASKILHFRTGEETQALNKSKDIYKERLGLLQDEVDAAVRAGGGMTDSWQLMHEDRHEVQSRALDASIQLEKERTGVMGQVWNDFSGGIETVFRTVAGDGLRGEFNSIGDGFNSMLSMMLSSFIGTVAQMVAKWGASSIAGIFSNETSEGASGGGSSSSDTAGWISTGIGVVGSIFGYADGGYHPGGLRVVGENGPELEYTGPSNIFNSSQFESLIGGGAMYGGPNDKPTRKNTKAMIDLSKTTTKARKESEKATKETVKGRKETWLNTDATERGTTATDMNAFASQLNTVSTDFGTVSTDINTASTNMGTASTDTNTVSTDNLSANLGGFMGALGSFAKSVHAGMRVGGAVAGTPGAVVGGILGGIGNLTGVTQAVEDAAFNAWNQAGMSTSVNHGMNGNDGLGEKGGTTGLGNDTDGGMKGGHGHDGDMGMDNDAVAHSGGYLLKSDEGRITVQSEEGVLSRTGMKALHRLNSGDDSLESSGDNQADFNTENMEKLLRSVAESNRKIAKILQRFEYTGIPQAKREAVA